MNKWIGALLLFIFLSGGASATNIALHKTIFYNGTWNSGIYPTNLNNVVDGDFSTYSSGNGFTYAITGQSVANQTNIFIDLGNNYSITNITFSGGIVSIAGGDTTYTNIQTSIDNITWNLTDTLSVSGAGTTLDFNKSYPQINKTIRYIRSSVYWAGINYGEIYWYEITVEANTTTLNLTAPTNTSTTASSTVAIQWQELPQNTPYTYQVATDSQYINLVSTGSGSNLDGVITQAIINLNTNTHYYWHVKNATSAYTPTWEFTTPAVSTPSGTLNIQAFDEQQPNNRIMTFYAQVYNATSLLNKTAVNGWANFTAGEVSSGQYFIRVIPNSSYSSRSVLATSPANVTLYLPSTANNVIDNVAFYLYDFVGLFPWQTSKFYIYKNNTLMYSSYFDAEAKAIAYLIQGDTYSIQIINGVNIWNFGNFIPIQTGSVKIAINNFGIDQNNLLPFSYNLTWSNTDIILNWVSNNNSLNSLNYTIYKGASKTVVDSLITSVQSGVSDYAVTNTTDIYYVTVHANTVNNPDAQYVQVIDYRAGNRNAIASDIPGAVWSYGTFTAPNWVYDGVSFTVIGLLGATFGAFTAPIGAVIVGIFALILAFLGWIPGFTLGIGVIGGFLFLAILYYMQHKEKNQ